jgi:hypothetical protein
LVISPESKCKLGKGTQQWSKRKNEETKNIRREGIKVHKS